MKTEEFEKRFTYQAPSTIKNDQIERYQALRNGGLGLAERIIELTPESREQSLAITNLEQVIFWANAAIARNE